MSWDHRQAAQFLIREGRGEDFVAVADAVLAGLRQTRDWNDDLLIAAALAETQGEKARDLSDRIAALLTDTAAKTLAEDAPGQARLREARQWLASMRLYTHPRPLADVLAEAVRTPDSQAMVWRELGLVLQRHGPDQATLTRLLDTLGTTAADGAARQQVLARALATAGALVPSEPAEDGSHAPAAKNLLAEFQNRAGLCRKLMDNPQPSAFEPWAATAGDWAALMLDARLEALARAAGGEAAAAPELVLNSGLPATRLAAWARRRVTARLEDGQQGKALPVPPVAAAVPAAVRREVAARLQATPDDKLPAAVAQLPDDQFLALGEELLRDDALSRKLAPVANRIRQTAGQNLTPEETTELDSMKGKPLSPVTLAVAEGMTRRAAAGGRHLTILFQREPGLGGVVVNGWAELPWQKTPSALLEAEHEPPPDGITENEGTPLGGGCIRILLQSGELQASAILPLDGDPRDSARAGAALAATLRQLAAGATPAALPATIRVTANPEPPRPSP